MAKYSTPNSQLSTWSYFTIMGSIDFNKLSKHIIGTINI